MEKEILNLPNEFYLLSADLSLTRPGFAFFKITNKVELIRLISVDNKKKKKPHGQILDEIMRVFTNEVFPFSSEKTFPVYFVREKEILHMKVPSERSVTKTVGLMDWLAYFIYSTIKNDKLFDGNWYEIYPVTVKCLVAGSGKATKEDVANSLEKYIGKHEYRCDDESDAAAVGIAWLIQQERIKEVT